ncbi:MAG: DUF3253 domain-containing protein [Planctomycetota bacterium]
MKETQIRRVIIELCDARGSEKTICPSEVARSIDEEGWRSLMPVVRRVASQLVNRGLVIATQKGELIDIESAKGPIRLARRTEQRDDSTPTIDLINLGETCSADLSRVDIETLGDLQRFGALAAFEAVMVDKLHRGVRKSLFHTMYLYAIWGAVHDLNCLQLPVGIREGLKHQAAALKADLLGT